jgi:predicted  nucleic acid-binding Zn-ribbon protein
MKKKLNITGIKDSKKKPVTLKDLDQRVNMGATKINDISAHIRETDEDLAASNEALNASMAEIRKTFGALNAWAHEMTDKVNSFVTVIAGVVIIEALAIVFLFSVVGG